MSRPPASYRFGPFTLDGAAFLLLRQGVPVPLSPKALDLLRYLVARPSDLTSKEELFAALWSDAAVTDNSLTQLVSDLRQALGDDPAKPSYIQTVARRGYRFIADVQPQPAAVDAPQASTAEADAPTPRAIAVLDFANVAGDAEFGWLSSGIAETVTNDLRAAGALRVIDRVRVVEAVRTTGGDLSTLRTELQIARAVVGSFQRSGDRLRITARVVDTASGESLADAKADGPITDVFDLQDRIVSAFAGALQASRATGAGQSHHETSSLEAYRAFTEGRVRLESLDASQLAGAIADFERAVALDSRYAQAHVGLANARFCQYESSRARNQPDAGLLARAIDHVRRAIDLERDLAEAHATLAFLLVSAGRAAEALASARRAVALEPGYWGHQFRLAHAAWGSDRLAALSRAMELYPDFPFAHFEAAMVHIARSALDRAESVLREGTIAQDRQAHLRQRYPANGLHWLLGLVRLARGDTAEAQAEFSREIDAGGPQLYAREFAMNAHDGAGFTYLRLREPAHAAASFRQALQLYPDHARSLVGLGAALATGGDPAASGRAFAQASAAIQGLRRGGRTSEALIAEAFQHTVSGRPEQAVASLRELLAQAELPFTGWTIPIEPLFDELRERSDFKDVVAALAQRSR